MELSLDFFKKHKKLSIILIAFAFLIITPFVLVMFKSVQVSLTEAPTERHYVDYMTGVVEPAIQVLITPDDIAQMKDDNINTLTLYPSTYLPAHLSFLYEMEKPFLIGVIKEAKNQGLAVRVSGQSGPSPPPEDAFTEEVLDVISARVLDWAEISEELGVEYFSPWTEVDCIGRENAIEWHAEILPKIRERFSGKVFAGWTCCSSDDVYTADLPSTPWNEQGKGLEKVDAFVLRVKASKDFDGVMLDFQSPTPLMMKYFFNASKPKEPEDSWRPNSLEVIAKATSEAADEVGIPIYVGEFYVDTKEAPFGISEGRVIFNKEEQAEYILNFLDIIMPYYDGVIHCFWSSSAAGIKDTPAEQVIKEKFGEYT